MNTLIFDNVSKTYEEQGQHAICAVQNINISLDSGEIVALVGPSGCGKSTILNLAAGFLAPSAGTIIYNNQSIYRPSRARAIVFQDDATFPWMSVQDNILFALHPERFSVIAASLRRGLRAAIRRWEFLSRPLNYLLSLLSPSASDISAAESLLDRVGLSATAHLWPRMLSGGMRKRLDLARAYALRSDVMLMDEPFASVDVLTKEKLQTEFLSIWQDTSATVLYITHDVEEAVFLAHRVLVMSKRPGHVRKEYRIPFGFPRDLSLKVRSTVYSSAA